MKFSTAFALIFACLVASSIVIQQVEAGKKKKLIMAALLLAALAKPKILPLPVCISFILPLILQHSKTT